MTKNNVSRRCAKGALSAYANAGERRRGARLARAAMRDSLLNDALADRFYNDDMLSAIELIMARRYPQIFKLHADLVAGFGEPYTAMTSELAYAAFMLGALGVGIHCTGANVPTERTDDAGGAQ